MKYRVVIVNYNKPDAVDNLLNELSLQSLPPDSVCVVDNSPEAGSFVERRPDPYPFKFELHLFPQNIGYSQACNFGAAGGDWDWLVLLNPDIEVRDRFFFDRIISAASFDTDLGCVGVTQLNPDGSYERVARRFPSLRAILGKRVPVLRFLFSRDVESYLHTYPSEYIEDGQSISVDWLQSSFLLAPRRVWSALGGFDEKFFVFMADTDLGARVDQIGLRSKLYLSFRLFADGKRSSEGGVLDIFRNKIIRIHIGDAIRYFRSRLTYRLAN